MLYLLLTPIAIYCLLYLIGLWAIETGY